MEDFEFTCAAADDESEVPGAVGGDHDGGGKVGDIEGDWKSAWSFWVEKLSAEKRAESERRKAMRRDCNCVGGPFRLL